MRIVHYHSGIRLRQGGVVRAVLDLSAGLAGQGHDVVLLTPDAADVPDAWRGSGPGLPRVVEMPTPPPTPLRLPRDFEQQAREVLTDDAVLHLHGMWQPTNIALGRLAERLGVPYVFTAHGMLDDWSLSVSPVRKQVYMRLFGRRLLARAAATHFCAEGEFRQASRRLPRPNGTVIPLLMDLSAYTDPRPARDPATPPRLSFLSRFHPVKGLELLLDAFDRLAGEIHDLELHVAGTGDAAYQSAIESHHAGLRHAERCVLHGFTAGAEKVRLLAESDLFVLPTLHENFGFVLFEALAAGTAVLTTPEANTWPEIDQAAAGHLTGRSVDELAAAIRTALADRAALAEMGRRGRDWVFKEFAPERTVGRYESLYRDALTRR